MKPRILIGVDNTNWCWTSTMKSLIYCLPEYDIEIIGAYKFKQIKDFSLYDFVYCRGYAHLFINDKNKNIMIPFISTLTTGGKAIEVRMSEMRKHAKRGWAVVVQNKVAYHRCLLDGYENVFIIPNGVNTGVYTPQETKPDIAYVGMAGNTKNERGILKGADLVLKACSNLVDKAIYYVETNSERPLNYEQMVKWYQALTIYAQPSESEGCSNSVFEAMSCGLPCLIVEGVGYHGEVCLDAIKHESGQVIFVKRDAEDIQKKIERLTNDTALYDRVSKNAREFALQHQWKYIALKYKKMFDEFIPIAKEMKRKQISIISEKIYHDVNADLSQVVDDFAKVVKLAPSTQTTISILNVLGRLK